MDGYSEVLDHSDEVENRTSTAFSHPAKLHNPYQSITAGKR